MTCLRDGLIPFENFEDVVPNPEDMTRGGTRPMEDLRETFLWYINHGQLSQEHMIEADKVLTAPDLAAGGDGFQYDRGTMLSVGLFTRERSYFLRYVPMIILESIKQSTIYTHLMEDNQSDRPCG
ncbi:hypothetical protein PT974_12530 [Cladobotryum mycophilum]|uniref:Uncharacterized protein n=1 Tax=Cladobotryum mycophilum TaxID=491253 RepID=A0ABR0S8D0_9HYPO